MEKINYNPNDLYVVNIGREDAKRIVLAHHYMKTFPAGAFLYFGIFHKGIKNIQGVAVFGKSTSTDSKAKLFPETVKPENILEMQRLWISDLMGKNAESKSLSLIVEAIKKNAKHIKVVWTYAGGCKNDCGIVYQSSGFMFLGSEECNDFYLTKTGEYKNIINALRFGKGPKGEKDKNKIALSLYGEGSFINSFRHYYFYPIDKAVRRIMQKKVKPFPKYSDNFRYNQQWVTDKNSGADAGA